MGEIFFGVAMILLGVLIVLTGVNNTIPYNPFYELLRMPRIRQRAYFVVSGFIACLVGLILILVGFFGSD